MRVDVAALSETVDVSTQEIESYYQGHQSDFMTEETVDIAYIEIKREDFLETVEVSEEELLSFFEETSESYAEPERRRVAHILIEVNDEVSEESARQKIDEIHARITTSGEGFTALAKEFSNDPGSAENGGDLGFNDPGTFVEEFEAVSNILTMNQLSAPVKTEFGYHLIKLLDLEAAKQPVFTEVREKVEAEFRELGAEEIFVNKSSSLSEISYESPDLVGPSEELELELKTMEKVARTGSNTGVANNQAVTDALFSPDVLFDGNNSNLLEITPNHHIVVRVTAHQPREVKALEIVVEQVSADIALEKSAELAETQAQEMVAMLEDGSITRFVADQYGLVWTVVADATRTQPGLDREINRQAFGLPRPEEGNKSVGYAMLADGDSAVISVTNVNNKDQNDMSRQELSNFARALASQQGAIDYAEFRDNLTASGSVNTL